MFSGETEMLLQSAARAMGEELYRMHVPKPIHDDFDQYIPDAVVNTAAEELALFVANVIQTWLDAGSERVVTLEELTPVIECHLAGWGCGEPVTSPLIGYEQGAGLLLQEATKIRRRANKRAEAKGTAPSPAGPVHHMEEGGRGHDEVQ